MIRAVTTREKPARTPRQSIARPNTDRATRGVCALCGCAGDTFELALCCVGVEPKDPAECLWCGNDLPKGRAYCNGACKASDLAERGDVLAKRPTRAA
jgi:hypothetical protein